MAPVATTGQPLSEPIELSLATSNLVAAGEPSGGAGSESGVFIPRVEMGGALRAGIGPVAIGLLYDHGANEGASPAVGDMPRPSGDTYGGGVTIAYSAAGNGPLRVGLELDLLRYSVPWKETWTCVKNCAGNSQPPVVEGRTGVGVYALGIVPSYRTPWGAIYGGATLRNHPTIDKGDVTTLEILYPVSNGPVNLVMSAGVEVRLVGTLRGSLCAYLPLASDPVTYPPTIAASLTLGLPVAR